MMVTRLFRLAGDWLARLAGAGLILYAEYMIINALFPNTPLK